MAFKIVTPATTEPVTLQEAKLHCKVITDLLDVEEYAEDSLITGWIAAARAVAEHYTGRSLATQTLEMAMDCFPEAGFDLDMPPVVSITSIVYTDLNGAEQTVSPLLYRLSTYGNARRVELAYDAEWPETRDEPEAVRVRYVTGYATTPPAVKSALKLMVGWFNEHRGSEMDPDDIQPPAAKSLLNTVKIWGW